MLEIMKKSRFSVLRFKDRYQLVEPNMGQLFLYFAYHYKLLRL